jgi:hypothetical protein
MIKSLSPGPAGRHRTAWRRAFVIARELCWRDARVDTAQAMPPDGRESELHIARPCDDRAPHREEAEAAGPLQSPQSRRVSLPQTLDGCEGWPPAKRSNFQNLSRDAKEKETHDE